MKAIYVKVVKCCYCTREFAISKSTHRFCSTSCRSASHSLSKRFLKKDLSQPNKISLVENWQFPLLANEKEGYKPSFIKDAASSSIPYLLGEIVKSLKGVNNSDIMEAILKNQAGITELQKELKIVKNQLNVKNSIPDPPKSPPGGGGVTLLN